MSGHGACLYTFSGTSKSAGPVATIDHRRQYRCDFGLGLDLMLAIATPDDQPDLGRRRVPERHRRPALTAAPPLAQSRPRGSRTASTPGAGAIRGPRCRRHIGAPSPPGLARRGGRTPCTKRSTAAAVLPSVAGWLGVDFIYAGSNASGPMPITALMRLFRPSANSVGVLHTRVFRCLMSK